MKTHGWLEILYTSGGQECDKGSPNGYIITRNSILEWEYPIGELPCPASKFQYRRVKKSLAYRHIPYKNWHFTVNKNSWHFHVQHQSGGTPSIYGTGLWREEGLTTIQTSYLERKEQMTRSIAMSHFICVTIALMCTLADPLKLGSSLSSVVGSVTV
jgi:hypothetical protein